jgi:hypothetical protein
MPEFLYAPDRERIATTNAWAFLHWLRTTRGIDLPDWAALQRWSGSDQAPFGQAIATFGRLTVPLRLARHCGQQEALVLRRADGSRLAFSRNLLCHRLPLHPLPPAGIEDGATPVETLPADVAAPLVRLWPPALLIRPLAELLLHADLRPDDRLLVIGAAWPWLAALLEGTTVMLAAASPGTLLGTAAEERATVLVAPAQALAEAAFQRARRRPNLIQLRTIIATGGPLSPEGRRRVYTWIKSDVLLLARTGDTFWGSPLEPVLVQPAATPALLTPPASAPAIR